MREVSSSVVCVLFVIVPVAGIAPFVGGYEHFGIGNLLYGVLSTILLLVTGGAVVWMLIWTATDQLSEKAPGRDEDDLDAARDALTEEARARRLAFPIITSFACFVVFIPFGGFLPLVFAWNLTTETYNSVAEIAIGAACMLCMLAVSAASIALHYKLKHMEAEEQAKVAVFHLRLLLRKKHVLLDAKIGRLMYDILLEKDSDVEVCNEEWGLKKPFYWKQDPNKDRMEIGLLEDIREEERDRLREEFLEGEQDRELYEQKCMSREDGYDAGTDARVAFKHKRSFVDDVMGALGGADNSSTSETVIRVADEVAGGVGEAKSSSDLREDELQEDDDSLHGDGAQDEEMPIKVSVPNLFDLMCCSSDTRVDVDTSSSSGGAGTIGAGEAFVDEQQLLAQQKENEIEAAFDAELPEGEETHESIAKTRRKLIKAKWK